MKLAEEVYEAAKVLLNDGLYRMVCYHAQECVEKSLKAILIERAIEFPRTHNVLDVAALVQEAGYTVPMTNEEALILMSVYRSRYPIDLGLLPYGVPLGTMLNGRWR